jgi:hypothetical protein
MQNSLRLLQRRGHHPPAARGPVHLALDALRSLRWRWSPPWTITTPDEGFDLLTVDLPLWAHTVRDALRRRRLQPAAERRADLQGCDSSLDVATTNRAWSSNHGGPSSAAPYALSSLVRSGLRTSGSAAACRMPPTWVPAVTALRPPWTPPTTSSGNAPPGLPSEPPSPTSRPPPPARGPPAFASAALSRRTSYPPRKPASTSRSACRRCMLRLYWHASRRKDTTLLALSPRTAPCRYEPHGPLLSPRPPGSGRPPAPP